jgi:hypothetical protein
MKRILSSVVIALVTLPATAGVTYDFRTVTSGFQASDQRARASVEGKNIRLDFDDGDGTLFHDGAVVVSHDGGATLDVIDPQAKTFFELDLSSLAPAGLADMLKLTNEKVNVRDAGDGGVIDGYPTHHTIVTAGADVALGGAMSMHFDVTMESWATDKVPMDAAAFLRRTTNTGLPMLDKLIAAHSDAVKGFPLKAVTNVKVMQGRNTTLEMTSTTTVTNVKSKAIPATAFVVPADYKKVASPVEKLLSR